MVSPILNAVKGELPSTSPFDLSKDSAFAPKDIWSKPAPHVEHGELWITYPFEEGYTSLDQNSRDPELAKSAKAQIDLHMASIVEHATNFGIDTFTAQWTVGELLTNATQYGAVSKNNSSAGLIRLEWFLDRDDSGPMLSLAVANPCVTLFDPSRYARMEISEFYSMESSSSNGHLGTVGLLSYLKENTKLTYLWEMTNGERTKLTMELIPEDAPDRPENYDELMKPTRVEVFKFDASNTPVPYSFEGFEQDTEKRVGAESVTVSCVVTGSGATNQT